jgi:hypothetical protein
MRFIMRSTYMIRDYSFTSPSLDGILSHDSIVYEGLERPNEIIRAFDRPRDPLSADRTSPEQRQILQEYFNDLYGLFMRKMSQFVVESDISPDFELKIQAMLQELIKVKKLLTFVQIV